MSDYELLGAAEKEVAKQILAARDRVVGCATEIAETLQEFDLDDVEGALLDSARKKLVVDMLAPLQGMGDNLVTSMVAVKLIALVMTKEVK